MGSSITAYRTFNTDDILHVIGNPSILDTIVEDGAELNSSHIDPNKACFIACEVNNEIAAVWIFDKKGAITLDVHAHVLPAFRKQYSLEIGNAVFSEIIRLADWAHKYTAEIPTIYPNVKAFAERFGFEVEGTCKECYLKNDEVVDKWILGATANRIKHELDQR